MAYTVAITNQKGGVGKTTTAVNLAAALAIAERRTLLVDADPQGNTTSGVGIAKLELQVSLYDVLVDEHPVHDVILPVPGLRHLSVLPATQDLVGAELQLVERPFRESALRRVLEPLEREYDYIVVDCPPSLGLLTLNVLAAVQQLIIPIQCEYYGLEGISQLLNTVRLVQQNINPGLAIGGVLLTMYDSRLNLCRQVAEDATEYFGPKVFGTPIPRNVRLAEAPSFGKPILLYDVQSVGAKSYLAVAQELLRRVEGAEVTIASAQVAAAIAHATATSAPPVSREVESREEEPRDAAVEDVPASVSESQDTASPEAVSETAEAWAQEIVEEAPAGEGSPPVQLDADAMPTASSEIVEAVADLSPAREAGVLAAEQEGQSATSQGASEEGRPHLPEGTPEPEHREAVAVSAAEIHAGEPPPADSPEDEASRHTHNSSEPRPEVTT